MSTEVSPDVHWDPDEAWKMRVGYVYAAVGICSLVTYPIGAMLLKVKCGWSCVPTVSDVERPLSTGAEVWNVDIARRVLVSLAVLIRVALVPTILVQVFPLLRGLRKAVLQPVRFVFYTSLAAWIASDIVQIVFGNDLRTRGQYTPHTIAVHIDIFALIVCHITLLVALACEAESEKRWLVVGTLALCKLSGAGLFLALTLSTNSLVWHFVEWAMIGAIGGLHVSVGLAMPASLLLNARRLKVHRPEAESSCSLVGPGCDAMQQSWMSSSLPAQLKLWP